jgi:hypothetical protein
VDRKIGSFDAYTSDINDLIIDQRLGRPPRLPPGSRERFEGLIERCLVDPDTLDTYVQGLRSLLQRAGADLGQGELLPEPVAEAVLNEGLRGLGDDDLAALALNPVGLYGLSAEIDDLCPEYWLDGLERAGRDLLQRLGVVVPPVEELIGMRDVELLAFPEPARGLGAPAPGAEAIKVVGSPSGRGVWDLKSADGAPGVPLPREDSQRCYGAPDQRVTLRLRIAPASDEPEFVTVQLEVSPPPRGDLAVPLLFPNGTLLTFLVPAASGGAAKGATQGGERLPAALFRHESRGEP